MHLLRVVPNDLVALLLYPLARTSESVVIRKRYSPDIRIALQDGNDPIVSRLRSLAYVD